MLAEPIAPRQRTVRISMPPPHSPSQRELITTPASVALFAGGRYGKTEAGIRRIIRAMILEPDLYYWVGLSWKSASFKKAWRVLYDYWSKAIREAGENPRDWINRSDKEIRVPGTGAILMCRSAENPDSIAGDGPRGFVGDEFTYWDEEVWSRFLQPSLADKNGWAFLMGRPFGRNWAANVWERAEEREGWVQRHYTIYDNPLIDRAVIEDLKRNTPSDVWRQEYMAECFEGVGSVFRGVDAVATLPAAEPEDGHSYVAGCDLAIDNDFTVLTVLDATDPEDVRQAHMERWRSIPWQQQLDRIAAVAERFGVDYLAVDKTGLGNMPFDELARRVRGPVLQGVTFNAGNKQNMVQALAVAIERRRIQLLEDRVQAGELKAYRANRKPTGAMSYSAPPGMHDDCVVALMLAWDGVLAGQVRWEVYDD